MISFQYPHPHHPYPPYHPRQGASWGRFAGASRWAGQLKADLSAMTHRNGHSPIQTYD
jgi:hypothetical protein